MMSLTPIGQETRLDKADFGGKAAALNNMTLAGLPVPPGFILGTEAFDAFIHACQLEQKIASLHDISPSNNRTIAEFSAEVLSVMKEHPFPNTLNDSIHNALAGMNGHFAVRSSATAEDGTETAWAGQLESLLYIYPEGVAESVKRVWMSLFSPRALSYWLSLNPSIRPKVAVIIQSMIVADVSGVMFGTDPTDGNTDRIIIEAAFGDCEMVVSGRVIPDHYVVDKSTRAILSVKVGRQTEQQVKGVITFVEAPDQIRQKLTDNQVIKLAKMYHTIEEHFDAPQDVEWVLRDGSYSIVQSRPVTTLTKTALDLERLDPSDYKVLFRMKDKASFFNNHFLLEGALRHGEPLIINNEGAWTFYLKKDSLKDLGVKGVRLLRSDEAFKRYESDFTVYLERAEQDIMPRWLNISPTPDSVKDLANDLAPLWDFYAYTEFVYHDAAYDFAQTAGQVEKQRVLDNLERLSHMKERGRNVFNAFIMKDGVLNRFLARLESLSGLPNGLARYLTLDELSELVTSNGSISDFSDRAMLRHKAYVIQSQEHSIRLLGDDEAVKIASLFIDYEQAVYDEAKEEIRGTVASAGIVRGRVVISPMLDRVAAEEVAGRMKKGDILVAQSTNHNLMILCEKAGAIITDQGGMLSHAAIISREMDKPCIVGTEIATKVLHEGETVEVNANEGIIRRLRKL